tara:strand:- start:80 stop:1381 length:1302 start_codon:yes stop_codon:yes gene_type:complete
MEYKRKYTFKKRQDIYSNYLSNLERNYLITSVDEYNEYLSERFHQEDFDKILPKLKSLYSKNPLFLNKEECLQRMEKFPGFFKKSIWNSAKDEISSFDLKELECGFGDNNECVIFLNRWIKIFCFDIEKRDGIFKTGIHLGKDSSWLWCKIENNSLEVSEFSPSLGGKTDNVEFKNKSILDFISHFIDLRIEQLVGISKLLKSENDKKIKNLGKEKTNILMELDRDNNGKIDIIEGQNDFLLLIKKHQKKIIELQRVDSTTYSQKFIKLNNYLSDKKDNLQRLFNEIKNVENIENLELYTGILRNEIHLLRLLKFNSLNMVSCLINDDIFTFYEIYEKLDKLGIFNSNWENEITSRLEKLEHGLDSLMLEIHKVGNQIINSICELSYVNEETNRILETELESIQSSIQSGNMLNLIQTYQMYKINQNTKGLRE